MSSCELLQVQQRSWYVEEEQVELNRSKKVVEEAEEELELNKLNKVNKLNKEVESELERSVSHRCRKQTDERLAGCLLPSEASHAPLHFLLAWL